ncbi:hypothetical protein NIES2100_79780 (plasmid) [Calothrix sp. NIES-2100]|uniref:hypothetical protein n=1 Tax=Calothrix sp. NIES-2100 TaxID=1954172 RepID=UPI000B622E15|nr:hypothetical protein NIES2100_79780 [Calothrix sp. NIES-2100]
MTFNQEAELQYLAQIKEDVKRGWLEMRSGGAFGLGYAHCKNCDAYIQIICTDSPGNRLEEGDPQQTVNCPNCSGYLGKFLSATRPVTLLGTKEKYKLCTDLSDLYAPSESTQAKTKTKFESIDDIPF